MVWKSVTWPVDGSSIESECRTNWFAKDVLRHHRTLPATLTRLNGPGCELSRLEEFVPTPEYVAEMPALAEGLERPVMLLVSAQKR